MEAWRVLLGLSVLLVLYGVLATLFNYETSPLDIALAVVFGAFGLYLGRLLTSRLNANEEE